MRGGINERDQRMPDIQLRFHKDMLVLSSPVDAMLARQGIDIARDREYLNLMEPDSIRDALQLEVMAGAHCVVATTEDITRARLAHLRMDADAPRLAAAALSIANEVRPQHVLAEIGPCGLPLDESSKGSLNENRKQYADAARAFEGGTFDAFFLNGFTRIADLKCALMGVAQVSDKPVFASVALGPAPLPPSAEIAREGIAEPDIEFPRDGYSVLDDPTAPPLPAARLSCLDPAEWPAAIDAMADLGAAVVGFETAEPITQALDFARTAVGRVNLPVLAQLCVKPGADGSKAKNLVPLEDIEEYTPDTMSTAAVKLYGAGVQFLRATGAATPAYTGGLAAAVAGLDVHR